MSITTTDSEDNKLSTKNFSWQQEATLVDRRNRFYHRILAQFSIFRVVLVVLVGSALLNADFMRWILQDAFPYIFRIVLIVSFSISQFILIFWFLGRTRMETIWPGTTTEGVSFNDYRGQPELLEQARQIVKLLRGVRIFEESGGEPMNGLLLEGPPGTGKTWMAKAISTEAGIPFFSIDASSMNSMFVGIAPLKVMNLYRKARAAARDYGAAIVFIDEIDAVGSRGGVATTGERAEMEGSPLSRNRLPIFFGMGGQGILSTLLVEMDGFSLEHGWWARKRTWFYKTILRRKPPKPQRRILTIGATNRISALDPALLRAGRFDKKLRVDAPDLEGRRDIFEYYMSKIAHDDTLDSLILASETPNYTPADIKHLLNEALRYALFDDRTAVTMADVRRAQPEHEMGLRQPIRNLAPEDKYRLAAHEGAHAIAIRIFRPNYRIARITIIRQGGAHGYVLAYPALEEYDYMDTYDNLMNQLRVAVAGKAGEMEFAGEDAQTLGVGIGWGDGSDFGRIRAVLYRMADAGMFGPLGANLRGTNYSPEMSEAMENTFRSVLEEVRMVLRIQREMGDALIKLLLEKEELYADDVEAFFDQYGLYTPKVDLNPYMKKTPAIAGGVSA
ncbi:MAG: AAA family ATPase [Anaerolineae bacterium]|nr:AAA family ATPase [Anaerolineae bacterium]MBN8619370.1 AAA family ATPase [Anaerolineae bacterium]